MHESRILHCFIFTDESFLLACCPASVSLYVNFSHFQPLLQKHLAYIKPNLSKASLDKGGSILKGHTFFPGGDNHKIAKNTLTKLKILRSTGPMSTKLGTNHPYKWRTLFFFSYIDIVWKWRTKLAKRFFSVEPLGQFKSYLTILFSRTIRLISTSLGIHHLWVKEIQDDHPLFQRGYVFSFNNKINFSFSVYQFNHSWAI